MTRIVVTLSADTVDGMLEQAGAAGDADHVECRLDALDRVDADALKTLAEALPGRAVATYRPEREGGAYKGPEATREVILNAALAHGFAGVDVEHDAPFADRVLAKARDAGALGILSRHDFHGTPGADAIVKFAEEARERGATVAKFAAKVTGAADAERLVTAALTCRERGLPVALMAVNDAFLRLLAPALGLALTYAAPAEQEATVVPGQLPASLVQDAHARLAPAGPTAQPRLVALLGDPVAHSKSHAFQNAAFNAAGVPGAYVPARVSTDNLGRAVDALRALDALGANVTVPHKVSVLRHVDALDATARAAGAANTLVQRDGHVTAFNTDGSGALDALAEAGVHAAGERVLLLGAGGAARAIAHALKDAGADLTITNRSRESGETLAQRAGARFVPWDERARTIPGATLVVNATAVGLGTDESPLPDRVLRRDLAVMDAVYRPGGTALTRAAHRAGARAVVPGEWMLLHQGARAFTLWTDRPAPVTEMRHALTEVMRG